MSPKSTSAPVSWDSVLVDGRFCTPRTPVWPPVLVDVDVLVPPLLKVPGVRTLVTFQHVIAATL